jgi:glc operon protein GlcG
MIMALGIAASAQEPKSTPAAAQQVETPAAKSAVFFDKQQMAAGFAKNEVLYRFAADHNYQITAGRREKPGEVEVHLTDTDIFYVVDGSFTIVTGGTVVGGRHTAATEIRGTSVSGGETRQLGKGDLIIIPKGTPHWTQKVDSPSTYLVVKVRDAK